MNKTLAKGLALVLSLIIYDGGYWLIYSTIPGIEISGVIIMVVLWSFLSFILSGAFRDEPDEESE